jgi:hypothetical protein
MRFSFPPLVVNYTNSPSDVVGTRRLTTSQAKKLAIVIEGGRSRRLCQ